MRRHLSKRSIKIRGQLTSISVEDPFWNGLKEWADNRIMTLTMLLEELDDEFHLAQSEGTAKAHNFSGSIRVAVLEYVKEKAIRRMSAR